MRCRALTDYDRPLFPRHPHTQFGYEVFKQDTTNAVMCAILVNDVLNAASPKNPANRSVYGVRTPLELFRSEAVHGGLWRSPYTVDSLGAVSAMIYFAGASRLYVAAAAVVAAAFGSGAVPKFW